MKRLGARRAAALLPPACALVTLAAWACGGDAPRRSMMVTVTAYNSVRAQTDAQPSIGAWGDRLEPGMKAVAVSPDLLEIGLTRGTEVHVEGLDGTWVVLDRTHGRWRRRIDLYMGRDVELALEWGVQERRIWWREEP